jgi:hypothetical protein
LNMIILFGALLIVLISYFSNTFRDLDLFPSSGVRKEWFSRTYFCQWKLVSITGPLVDFVEHLMTFAVTQLILFKLLEGKKAKLLSTIP